MDSLKCTLKFLEYTMPKFIDRTGQQFDRLRVLTRFGRDSSAKTLWLCVCECGTFVRVNACALVTGNTRSCGCLWADTSIKHGGWNKSSYNTWRAMMRRCYVPTDKDYPRWGGRGVKVAEAWHDYASFVRDMGEPEGDQTLDRQDPDGDYCKENCRWATKTVQARNIRVPKRNRSGAIGVTKRGPSWYGEITCRGKKYYSKACKTFEEAAAARKAMELQYWGTER